MISSVLYAAALTLYLTATGPHILELMRVIGSWEGLAVALCLFLVALVLVPALVAWKVKKAKFGKVCLAWCVTTLLAVGFLAPTGRWVKERGSFVPALIWGPNSGVVQKVFVDTMGLGEGWKERPNHPLTSS